MSRPASMRLEAVDLFCGVGGLTHGLTRAGITVRAGVDTDAACAYPYSKNNGAAFIHRSVTDMSAADIAGLYHPGSLRVLAGCAPCQTFSTYQRSVSDDDRRWWLLRHVGDVATDLQPECVVVENVPGLAQHAVFAEFTDTLVTAGFHVSVQVVRCEEYGIPQSRKRLVVLASRLGPIDLLTPHQFGATPTSVRHAIGGGIVPHLSAGASDPFDRLHRCAALTPLNMRRIQASTPGGTWRDWPADLQLDCHKKASGSTYGSVYGRMHWDHVAPTITTQFFGYGNGRFGHPEQDRALSLREGAILQGFPVQYRFARPEDPLPIATVGRLIGNAVPVGIGELIGASIISHVRHAAD